MAIKLLQHFSTQRALNAILLIIALGAMHGCGQKGALYYAPEATQSSATEQSNTPDTAPTPETSATQATEQ